MAGCESRGVVSVATGGGAGGGGVGWGWTASFESGWSERSTVFGVALLRTTRVDFQPNWFEWKVWELMPIRVNPVQGNDSSWCVESMSLAADVLPSGDLSWYRDECARPDDSSCVEFSRREMNRWVEPVFASDSSRFWVASNFSLSQWPELLLSRVNVFS